MTPPGVPDDHPLALAVARQQVEGQAAVAPPERIDRKAEIERAGTPAAATPRAVGTASPVAIVSSASGSRRISESARHRPRCSASCSSGTSQLQPERLTLGAPDPALAVHGGRAVEDGDHRLRRQVKTDVGLAVAAAGGLERGEVVAHRTGERTHGPYRVTVQLLLIRHALPLRSEPGAGLRSRPVRGGHRAGQEAARRVGALPDHPPGQQPAAARGADRATGGRRARAARSRSTIASPSTTATSSTTSRSSRSPPSTPRSWRGWPAATCRAASTRTRFWPASAPGSATSWRRATTRTPSRYSATAG